jgi:hypothetical protein
VYDQGLTHHDLSTKSDSIESKLVCGVVDGGWWIT